VRPIGIEIINSMIAQSTADFAQEYAYQFSTRVLCRHLHVKHDWNIFNDWSSEMEQATGASTRVLCKFLKVNEYWRIYDEWSSEIERLTGAGTAKPGTALPASLIAQVIPYLQELTAERRANPGTDAVSGIIAGDPALQEPLRTNPGRINDAVEECLRTDAPHQRQPRIATSKSKSKSTVSSSKRSRAFFSITERPIWMPHVGKIREYSISTGKRNCTGLADDEYARSAIVPDHIA